MYSSVENKTRHIFTWTIQNFRACTQKNNEFLISPVFLAKSVDETTWYVMLYPKGNSRTSEEYVSSFLARSINCSRPGEIECNYTLEAIDKNNKSLGKHEYTYNFDKGNAFGAIKLFQKSSDMNSLDVLKIEVTFKKGPSKTFSKNVCFTNMVTDKISFNQYVKNSASSCADSRFVSFSDNLLFEIIIEIPEDEVLISFLRKKGFDKSQILICSVTLLDLKGEEADSTETVMDADKPNNGNSWVLPAFLHKSKISAEKDKYLKEDCFTLKFDLALSNGKTVDFIKDLGCQSLDCILKAKEDPSSTLKNDFKSLLTNPIYSDVKLHAEEKVFSVHKNILCARSRVFSTMFHQDMAENQTGEIHISDISAGTLNSLLEFIYTGDTEILDSDSALKLMVTSEKYEVLSLKKKCASALELLLSDGNVCDVLFTADLVQEESLKFCAVNYIKVNSKNVFKSDGWKKLVKKNLNLATETVCEVTISLAI